MFKGYTPGGASCHLVLAAIELGIRNVDLIPRSGRSCMATTEVFLPGESNWQRSLAGHNP